MTRRGASAGFTLIEILAVVAIFALLAGLIAPRVGALASRSLRLDAEEMAGRLEFGRQRAVVTGIPHRFVFDLEGGGYWLEWEVSDEDLEGEEDFADAPPLGLPTPLELTPPHGAERNWQPVPGHLGDIRALDDDLEFGGLHTTEGWVERGEPWIRFERDGTTAPTEIHLDDNEGRSLVLEVRPLAGGVRIGDVAG